MKCLINDLVPSQNKTDIRERAFRTFRKSGSNKLGTITNNPSLDLKSENSSIYKNSVAALSAQPSTLICKNCKKRVSSNNLLLNQNNQMTINPFNIPQGLGFKQKSMQFMSQNLTRLLTCQVSNLNKLQDHRLDVNPSPFTGSPERSREPDVSVEQKQQQQKLDLRGLMDEIKYVNQDIQIQD